MGPRRPLPPPPKFPVHAPGPPPPPLPPPLLEDPPPRIFSKTPPPQRKGGGGEGPGVGEGGGWRGPVYRENEPLFRRKRLFGESCALPQCGLISKYDKPWEKPPS